MNLLDIIYKFIAPLLSSIILLIIYIYKTRLKLLNEQIERLEKRINEINNFTIDFIKDLEFDLKDIISDMKNMFREGMKEEKIFFQDIMKNHDDMIKKTVIDINEISNRITKLETENKSIKNMCNERHKKEQVTSCL